MKKITYLLAVAFTISATTSTMAQRAETVPGNPNAVVNQSQTIPNTGTYHTEGGLLYDNGPFITEVGTPNISLLEDQALGLTILGFGVSFDGGFSVADQAVFPNDVNITSVDFFAYQTGAPTSPSPLQGIYLQIWDGDPSQGGSNIVYGDLTTNLADGSIWFDTYRQSETTPGTSRAIMIITADTPNLTLPAGTYWFQWSVQGDAGFSGPWQPPVTIIGQATTGDALQFDGSVWSELRSGTAPNDFAQGVPFNVYGTEVLGTNEVSLSSQIAMFPNPAQKEVTISNNSNITLEKADIYNLQGKLIQSVELNNNETTLDISNFASGVYMVQIASDKGSVTKKLIKK